MMKNMSHRDNFFLLQFYIQAVSKIREIFVLGVYAPKPCNLGLSLIVLRAVIQYR